MSSRLTFDLVPEPKGDVGSEWAEKLRRVLDASFRSLREVLSSLRMRESFRVYDCVIDTGRTPYAIVKVAAVKKPPLGVLLLRATNQRTPTGVSATGLDLQWEYRGAAIVIHGSSGLSASTRYDCVIAVLE